MQHRLGSWLAILFLASAGASSPQAEKYPVGKKDLAALAALVAKPGGQPTDEDRKQVLGWIATDALTTPADFRNAARIYRNVQWYEDLRIGHELAMMALVLGDSMGPTLATQSWDMLMISMGEPQRFGTIKVPPNFDVVGKYDLDPTPKSVQAVFGDLAAARAKAATAKNNPEMQRIVDADQAARRRAPPASLDGVIAMQREDLKRQKEAMAVLESGELVTAQDFENAGLVFQHSFHFEGFRLAHELIMASIALGGKSDLISATYDRMLLSRGYRQRLGSQLNEKGISPMDTVGINDRMRTLLGTAPLATLKSREKEILKRALGG